MCYNPKINSNDFIMIDITLIAVGRIKDRNISSLISDYIKRIKPFAKLKIIEVEPVSFNDNNKEFAKNLESEKILKILEKEESNPKGAVTYLLAERGQSFNNSIDLANWYNKKSPLILVIGGSLGFSDALYSSHKQISLSPLTFPHELARLVFVEQLYRSSLIISGKSYHY